MLSRLIASSERGGVWGRPRVDSRHAAARSAGERAEPTCGETCPRRRCSRYWGSARPWSRACATRSASISDGSWMVTVIRGLQVPSNSRISRYCRRVETAQGGGSHTAVRLPSSLALSLSCQSSISERWALTIGEISATMVVEPRKSECLHTHCSERRCGAGWEPAADWQSANCRVSNGERQYTTAAQAVGAPEVTPAIPMPSRAPRRFLRVAKGCPRTTLVIRAIGRDNDHANRAGGSAQHAGRCPRGCATGT